MTNTNDGQSSVDRGFVIEIEQEVLGALLVSGTVAPILGVLRPDHFLEPIHRRLFQHMLLAHERYGRSALSVVYGMFDRDEVDTWEKVTTRRLAQYLASLAANTTLGIGGIKLTAANLIHQSARIGISIEAERLALAANDPGADPIQLVRTATRTLDDIAASLRGGNRGKTRYSLSEAADVALDEVQSAIHRGGGITGITWGLTDINKATGGIHRGEMVVLGARPSMGKTAVGLGIGIKAAQAGFGVGFISLEMGANRLAMRALTDIAYDWGVRVPYSDLITGNVSEEDFEKICDAKQRFNALPLWIEQQSGLSISDLRVKVERMQDVADRAGSKIDLLIVDYLQLVAASSRYSGNRNNEVSEISAGLRQIARENDVAMIALSQLSRGVESREDKRPMLADLRDSGSLEQDADMVAFLYREAYYLEKAKGKDANAEMERLDRLEQVESKLQFIIAKQRNGAVKTIELFVDIAASAVRNAARAF
ncbi:MULTISPECIES: DnaB-like helicase C-terminal domain-containing protein [unclassified Rhizobium]|uniref:replicative DNA helicase n=1 Tax=unclassified Rhizobium TaxID=2613769 RepID=UPI0016163317|nr:MULTISPECIES: DnaB-like helicase C-terminal domain-containing protein [unclassified Rhizobium]MBB3385528.1 replicative DNA helicase [Rhizobium sp. BK098]MBB3617233.1 replicative DNA helicase [Rhizobium sp. BK609]MBB3682931.1 replicative DNA helicase [Rhizobium sp. BK612]